MRDVSGFMLAQHSEAETARRAHRIPRAGLQRSIMALRIRVLRRICDAMPGVDRIRAHPRLRRNWYLVGDTCYRRNLHPGLSLTC